MGMTFQGRVRYDLANQFGLGDFYQPEVGNIIIATENLTREVRERVDFFLLANREWVMGYEEVDEGEYVMYLTTAEDLI